MYLSYITESFALVHIVLHFVKIIKVYEGVANLLLVSETCERIENKNCLTLSLPCFFSCLWVSWVDLNCFDAVCVRRLMGPAQTP